MAKRIVKQVEYTPRTIYTSPCGRLTVERWGGDNDYTFSLHGEIKGHAMSGMEAERQGHAFLCEMLEDTAVETADLEADHAASTACPDCGYDENDPWSRGLFTCYACEARIHMNGVRARAANEQTVDTELAAQGLRRADESEAGWYVLTSNGKVWATDEPASVKTVDLEAEAYAAEWDAAQEAQAFTAQYIENNTPVSEQDAEIVWSCAYRLGWTEGRHAQLQALLSTLRGEGGTDQYLMTRQVQRVRTA